MATPIPPAHGPIFFSGGFGCRVFVSWDMISLLTVKERLTLLREASSEMPDARATLPENHRLRKVKSQSILAAFFDRAFQAFQKRIREVMPIHVAESCIQKVGEW